ncbi:hypothetical protein [Profundibacter sp.]
MKPKYKRRPKSPIKYYLNFHPSWIIGQRLGALAWAITQINIEEAPEESLVLKKLTSAFVREIEKLELHKYPNRAVQLPKATLHLCCSERVGERVSIPKQVLSGFRTSLEWISKPRDLNHSTRHIKSLTVNRCSMADGADLVAQMILFSDLNAVSVSSALEFFVADSFAKIRSETGKLDKFQRFLDQIRSPANSTTETIRIVNKMCGFLILISKQGILVKNSVIDSLLFWPLLVYRRELFYNRRRKEAGSYSFPIMIDVKYDGNDNVDVLNDWVRLNRPKEFKAFTVQVEKMFKTAKELWRSKNGHVQKRWDEVKNASCVVDFRLADKITQYTNINPLWQDNSAEAYLVQAFLTRLIGRHVSMNAAVSARVGKHLNQRSKPTQPVNLPTGFSISENDTELAEAFIESRKKLREDGAFKSIDTGLASSDRWIFKVAEEQAKYRYAAASRKYRKLILHSDNVIADSERANKNYLEVNYARTLSAVSDAAQLGGWRQFDYPRCPDINHLLHRDPSLLPAHEHELVVQTKTVLRSSQKNVVELDDGHSVLAVASILKQLNGDFRFNQSRVPPPLSWSFIRAVEGETDFRFWHIFLKTIGASDLAIKEHFLKGDTDYTAQLISSIMNGDVNSEELGCTSAPDVVVVFAAKNACNDWITDIERRGRPLDYQRVVEALQKLDIKPLRGPFNRVMGGSRIIFLQGDVRYMNRAYFKLVSENIEDGEDLFDRLSMFDTGFTVQMAMQACKGSRIFIDTNHAKTLLDHHVEVGTIWKGGQLYFLPHALRTDGAEDTLDSARALKRVANAVMPGLGMSGTSGFSAAECFEVENCRDAQRYLVRAKEAAVGAKSNTSDESVRRRLDNICTVISCEQDFLVRFFDMPSWGVVTYLSKNAGLFSRKDVYRYAEDLLAKAESHAAKLFPSCYTICVSPATNALQECFENGEYDMVAVLKDRIEELFDVAEKMALSFESTEDQNDWLVHVLTWKVQHYRRFNSMARGQVAKLRGGYNKERLVRLDDRILELSTKEELYGVFPNAGWYLLQGDQEKSAEKAQFWYWRSAIMSPKYFACYPRLFGTLDTVEHNLILSLDPGRQFWQTTLSDAYEWACKNKRGLSGTHLPRHVRERIQVGIEHLSKFKG